jgi:hypothetical protein
MGINLENLETEGHNYGTYLLINVKILWLFLKNFNIILEFNYNEDS